MSIVIHNIAARAAPAKSAKALITVFSAPLEGAMEAGAGADDEAGRAELETALFLEAAEDVGAAAEELAPDDDAALDVDATAAPPTVLGSCVLVA